MPKMLSWVRGTKSVQDFLWGIHDPCPLLRKNKLGAVKPAVFSEGCKWLPATPRSTEEVGTSKEGKHPAVLTPGVAASPHRQCPHMTQAAKPTQEALNHHWNKSPPLNCFLTSPSSPVSINSVHLSSILLPDLDFHFFCLFVLNGDFFFLLSP